MNYGYNTEKTENERHIEATIKGEIDDVLHGLLVVNMDDYAVIRDMIGRDEMEKLLSRVDDAFHKLFRGSDIVAKLKGDEFLVLTKNIKEITNVELLAARILNTVAGVDTGVEDIHMTCSVGISIYPFHSTDYEELKSKAYRAMYRAKANGKNVYWLYDEALTKILFHDYVFNKKIYSKIKNKDLYSIIMDRDLLEICSNLLRDGNDALTAMHSILEIGCLYLGFSRVYYYSPEGVKADVRKKLTYTNPGFEYTAENEVMRALREDMQIRISERYNSLTLIDSDDESVDEEIRLTLKDKDVNQLLYFPLDRGKLFRGAFMFENVSVNKLSFDEDELEKLDEQMRSIQSYFFSANSKRFAKENLAKLKLFENIPASVYIIDAQTHVIQFANVRAKEHVDGGHIGDVCYSTFCNRSIPCDNCPLKKMDSKDESANGIMEYYNYATREWCNNLYSWMDVFENENKAVMISVDVSGYVNDLDKIEKLIGGADLDKL